MHYIPPDFTQRSAAERANWARSAYLNAPDEEAHSLGSSRRAAAPAGALEAAIDDEGWDLVTAFGPGEVLEGPALLALDEEGRPVLVSWLLGPWAEPLVAGVSAGDEDEDEDEDEDSDEDEDGDEDEDEDEIDLDDLLGES